MEINLQPVDLGDDIIRLLPLEPAHFEPLYKLAGDPLIWEQHPERDRWKREVFERFFTGALESRGAFLIMDIRNGQPAGSSRFYEYSNGQHSLKIGYTFFAREYWGTGFNNRVKRIMLDYAFTLVDRVVFDIGIHNTRSRRAIEKLGAVEISNPEPEKCSYAIYKEGWSGA